MWNDLLESLDPSHSLKRDLDPEDNTPAKKEKKTLNTSAMKEAYENNSLNKLTVAVLAGFLRDTGVSTSGLRKAQLVSLVGEYFSKS